MAEMDMLIPGLPEEIARECLARVPYGSFRAVRSTCKLWRDEVDSAAFHHLRRTNGLTTTVVALTQSEPPSPTSSSPLLHKHASSNTAAATVQSYRLALHEPDTGAWNYLPAIPSLPNGIPLFCQLAAAGRSLVVVGGWDPSTWAASDEIFIYDFTLATWRRGARMPGPKRSFFACASDSDNTVFVAGGHDDEKNALRSALAYDVARDEWAPLPDMAAERDECKGVFHGGVFHVVGGYSTEMQGQFGKSSESFDVATWRWGPVQEDALEAGTCPRTCVAGGAAGEMYRCRGGLVEVRRDGVWRAAAELPEDARLAPCVVALNNKLMVVGATCHGGPHAAYTLEVDGEGKRCNWRRAVVPEEYSGHVQAGCCLNM